MRAACALGILGAAWAIHPRMSAQQLYKACSTSSECREGFACLPVRPGVEYSMCQVGTDPPKTLSPLPSTQIDYAATQWLVMEDVALAGSDIKAITKVNRVEDCVNLCENTQECRAISYDTSKWPAGVCHLKKFALNLSPNATMISATLYPITYICTAGGDNPSAESKSSIGNFQDCFNICSKDRSACIGFTWTQGTDTVVGNCSYRRPNVPSISPPSTVPTIVCQRR